MYFLSSTANLLDKIGLVGENAGKRRRMGARKLALRGTNGYWGELGTRASLVSLNKVARERAERLDHPQAGGTGDKAGRRGVFCS